MSPTIPNEWPFTVGLRKLVDVFADDRYQRPPQEFFVEKLVSSFDDTLVGVVDVSDRGDDTFAMGRYAILDGLQRISAMKKLGKTTVWCAIYPDFSLADEATFFVRKNKDRRSVHAFYSLRARMVSGEKKAQEIFKIANDQGFKLHVNARPDDHLAAIAAVEEVHGWSSLERSESLSAVLRTIQLAIYGRRGAKEGDMIRGLGRFFQPFNDNAIDLPIFHELLAEQGPTAIVAKAREFVKFNPHSRLSTGDVIARDLLKSYNRKVKQGKLNAQFLHKRG